MSYLGDAADFNPVIKFLSHTLHVCGTNLITGLTSAASPRLDISSTCKGGQKLGVSLPLLTCPTSAWPSRLLYRRGRKSRVDLWITLYIILQSNTTFICKYKLKDKQLLQQHISVFYVVIFRLWPKKFSVNEISHFQRLYCILKRFLGHSLKMAVWKMPKHVGVLIVSLSFN
jgi:hypothetical protein